MTNDNDISPIMLSNRTKPWWMDRIHDFDALEIWPCKHIDIAGREDSVMCKREEATHWTVYAHFESDQSSSNIKPIDRFWTEGEAQKFCERLKSIFPNLRGQRPAVASQSASSVPAPQ